MRQADKNRAVKAYDLVAQAEKKLRGIKWENLEGRASFHKIRALYKSQGLRQALLDLINIDKPE